MTPIVKIIAFDLETTGLEATKEEIIEVGAILFSVKESKGRIVPEKLDTFQSLVKSPKPVPENATKINNITNEMLAEAPPCADVLKKFKTFCDNANCLISHNAPFDTGFFNVAYGKYSVLAPETLIVDNLKIARNLEKLPNEKGSYKLINIAKIFENRGDISLKVTEDSAHRAVYDCELLMHVFVALLRNRLSIQEWEAQSFLQNLKKKGIYGDATFIKPIRPKAASLF